MLVSSNKLAPTLVLASWFSHLYEMATSFTRSNFEHTFIGAVLIAEAFNSPVVYHAVTRQRETNSLQPLVYCMPSRLLEDISQTA